MKIIPILIIVNFLISCGSLSIPSEIKQDSNGLNEIVNAILKDYDGMNTIFLCERSVNYNTTEIVTHKRSLKQALRIDLIEEYQKYSPPNNDKQISEIISNQDLQFMRKQTDNTVNWQEINLIGDVTITSCGKERRESKSTDLIIGISKPLFNKEKTYSVVFVTKSTSEYTVTLMLFEKTENGWGRVLNLNM